MPLDPDPLVGFATDTLRFDRLLGRGDMGAVYRGVQLRLDRPVAIKVIAPALTADPVSIGRFAREARTMGRLHHAHVISVHDFSAIRGPDGQRLYVMVMEFVDGQSLGRMAQVARVAGRGITVRDILAYHRQACLGLAAAHELGIIHRDIKPDNIMVTTDGIAKLADFGLARGDDAVQLTHTGALLGSPAYMAPEACRGEEPGALADIYSMGCSLFHMLTGTLPYPGGNILQMLHDHSAADVPDLRSRRPDLGHLAALVATAMAKSPEGRFASASLLATELDLARARTPGDLITGQTSGITAPTLVGDQGPWVATQLSTAITGPGRQPSQGSRGTPMARPVQPGGTGPSRTALTVPDVPPVPARPTQLPPWTRTSLLAAGGGLLVLTLVGSLLAFVHGPSPAPAPTSVPAILPTRSPGRVTEARTREAAGPVADPGALPAGTAVHRAKAVRSPGSATKPAAGVVPIAMVQTAPTAPPPMRPLHPSPDVMATPGPKVASPAPASAPSGPGLVVQRLLDPRLGLLIPRVPVSAPVVPPQTAYHEVLHLGDGIQARPLMDPGAPTAPACQPGPFRLGVSVPGEHGAAGTGIRVTLHHDAPAGAELDLVIEPGGGGVRRFTAAIGAGPGLRPLALSDRSLEPGRWSVLRIPLPKGLPAGTGLVVRATGTDPFTVADGLCALAAPGLPGLADQPGTCLRMTMEGSVGLRHLVRTTLANRPMGLEHPSVLIMGSVAVLPPASAATIAMVRSVSRIFPQAGGQEDIALRMCGPDVLRAMAAITARGPDICMVDLSTTMAPPPPEAICNALRRLVSLGILPVLLLDAGGWHEPAAWDGAILGIRRELPGLPILDLRQTPRWFAGLGRPDPDLLVLHREACCGIVVGTEELAWRLRHGVFAVGVHPHHHHRVRR